MSKEKLTSDREQFVVDVKGVSKAFTARRVLDRIDIEVGRGECVFICGINGAGKSTLLYTIAGLLGADSGSVKLCGYSVAHDPEKAKAHLGVISHKSMVYPDLTVIENLSFFTTLYGVKNAKARIDELLSDVKLTRYKYDKAGILSRGLLQRLAIARALVHKPSVLLADEPFTGLDKKSCDDLRNTLSDFVEQGGTVMMTTHDTRMGLACASRVIILDGSKLILDRPTEEIDADSFDADYISYGRGVV
ncbi:MAG: heme ABC exporter ATP-binding protein CcmA [Anaerohalosphaera sp.]|nr:heme ABC exporter ATP-binding protein CcmA [Anaerohalosphaera sp.]